MGIGQRKQVQLIQYTADKNIAGAWIEVAGTPRNLWAEISNPSGFRAYQNGQTQLGETKDFLIRFRFDLFPNCNWKIVYGGRRWTISENRAIAEKQFYYRLTATSKSDD